MTYGMSRNRHTWTATGIHKWKPFYYGSWRLFLQVKSKSPFALHDHNAQTIADKLVTEVKCGFGVPYRIHSDQGREFESDLLREMCSLHSLAKTRTTSYRPQSEGMVERYNRTLATMLSMFFDEKRTNWNAHLPYVLMTYRASVHESTKCTPNLLTIYHPHITLETDVRTRMLNGYKMLCNGHLSLRMKTFNLVSWNRNVTMTWSTNRDDTVSVITSGVSSLLKPTKNLALVGPDRTALRAY